MLDDRTSDLGAQEGSVLEEFRPGKGIDDAEILGEAVLHFDEHGVILIRAQGIVMAGDAAQKRVGIKQLVEGYILAGEDGSGESLLAGTWNEWTRRILRAFQAERIGNQLIPQERVKRTSVGVKLRRQQLLPKGEAGKILIAVANRSRGTTTEDTIGLVVRITDFEEPAL